MNFLIITHAKHSYENNHYYSYAPYVTEMNLWTSIVEKTEIIAPIINHTENPINSPYESPNIIFNKIPAIEFTSFYNALYSAIKLPLIFAVIFKACIRADHIHLRCPGNIGLIGCFVQVFFPKKRKTAKYAGNWDPNSKQPISYKLQKWMLSNTFLTKNMQVLVYGQWKNQTKNIKPFFTASFKNDDIQKTAFRDYNNVLNFMFVGSLVEGKRPLFAVQIIEALFKKGKKVKMDIYGDGPLKNELQSYINSKGLNEAVVLHGNQSKKVVKNALKKAHFLILPSKSEGWPKVIAEAMFFGVIPISTNISCVGWMLDEGRRGILIDNNLPNAVNKINNSIKNVNLEAMSIASSEWSCNYTLDAFENEIIKLLKTK